MCLVFPRFLHHPRPGGAQEPVRAGNIGGLCHKKSAAQNLVAVTPALGERDDLPAAGVGDLKGVVKRNFSADLVA